MITLDHVIPLTAGGTDIRGVRDAFGEKIRANYAIMAAAFSPKKLLFLLVNPPDADARAGDRFYVAANVEERNTNNIAVDVVNNILNRLVLEDSRSMSYQDSVYVETALRKIGIEDVAVFVRQAKTLMAEHRHVGELLSFYRENRETLRESFLAAGEAPDRTPPAARTESARERAPVFMHREIFERLRTDRLTMCLARVTQSASSLHTRVDAHEMRLSEHVRNTHLRALNDYRRQTLTLREGDISYRRNHYETGRLLAPPPDEQTVITQALSAALLQIIDNASVVKSERHDAAGDTWFDFTDALYEAARMSVQRYALLRERETERMSPGGVNALRTHMLLILKESETLTEHVERERRYAPASRARPDARTAATEAAGTPERPGEKSEKGRRRETRKTLHSLSRIYDAQRLAEAGEPRFRASPGEAGEAGDDAVSERLSAFLREFGTDGTAGADGAAGVRTERVFDVESARPEMPARADADVPRMTGVRETGDERLLREALERVERENTARFERVKELRTERTSRAAGDAPPTPDRRRIMKDALRAMTEPEEVMAALLREADETADPAPPDTWTELVFASDETSKRALEALRLLHEDPRAAAAAGIVRADGPDALMADIAALRRDERVFPGGAATDAETTVREVVTETLRQSGVTAGDAPRAFGNGGGASDAWRVPPPIIHVASPADRRGDPEDARARSGERAVTEAEIRKNVLTETNARVTQTWAQDGQAARHTAEKTAEDIAELINTTLTRRIGIITDQVYGQLEKRLETERARRGR